MENLKTEELNTTGDALIGWTVLATAGVVLYKIGKKRGAQEARSKIYNYIQGALLVLEIQSDTKDE